jgi:hypothetical protein
VVSFYHSSDQKYSSHCLSNELHDIRPFVVKQTMGHDLLTRYVDTNGAAYRGMLSLPTAEDGDSPPHHPLPTSLYYGFHCRYGYATRPMPFQAFTTGRGKWSEQCPCESGLTTFAGRARTLPQG